MPNFMPYSQKQGAFFSLVPDQLLEAMHPARIVCTVVEMLDLSRIYEYYSCEGSKTYHPKMMIKVLFYGYLQGVFSGRALYKNLCMRADFIFLSGGQLPDFRTLNNFRTRHRDELPDLFVQIVALTKKLGMISFENLAVDGQKIQANASFKKSYDKKRLKKNYDRVKKGMEKLLEKEISEAFTEEMRQERLTKLEKQREKLDEVSAILDKLKDEKANINSTDTDAATMRHKDGRSVPSYNHQCAVDEAYGVTVAIKTTSKNDGSKDLFDLVDDAKKNAGDSHKNVLADSGFCDYGALEEMETKREEEFYVPDKRFKQAASSDDDNGKTGKYDKSSFKEDEEGIVRCPAGKEMEVQRVTSSEEGHTQTVYRGNRCGECPQREKCTTGEFRTITVDSREPFREKMRERLRSDEGREIYMKRQWLVEAGNGHDQKNRGWRQHSLRGDAKCALEFCLMRIGANLNKIILHKAQELLAMC